MSAVFAVRALIGSAVLSAVAALAYSTLADATDAPAGGDLGFMVADFGGVGPEGTLDASACPNGTSLGYHEIYARSEEGQRRADETEAAFTRRLEGGIARVAMRDGESVCMNPTLQRDPYYRTLQATNVTLRGGIDLDGRVARSNGRPAPGTCAHDDFAGANGVRGVDNQWLRVNGCRRPNQTSGGGGGIMQVSWGILIALHGVDDLRNDEDVQVGLYANADEIQLGTDREPLPDVTYSAHDNPRYRAVAHGRLRNGVLTTDPVDVRFYHDINSLVLDRPLRDARIEARLNSNGELEGYLAGYTPIEDAYDMNTGFRNGRDRFGELAPLRLRVNTASGAASVLGYTCEGVYEALKNLADGHRDPETGRCTSISTQYHFRAIPAFVMDSADMRAASSGE